MTASKDPTKYPIEMQSIFHALAKHFNYTDGSNGFGNEPFVIPGFTSYAAAHYLRFRFYDLRRAYLAEGTTFPAKPLNQLTFYIRPKQSEAPEHVERRIEIMLGARGDDDYNDILTRALQHNEIDLVGDMQDDLRKRLSNVEQPSPSPKQPTDSVYGNLGFGSNLREVPDDE